MTPEERQMLTDLANKIAQTPPPQKDPEADELIRTRIASRPDAVYILTQTVLIQNIALEQARQELEQMRQAQQQAQPRSGSFLGSWGSPVAPPPPQAPAPVIQSGGMSGFLRSAATTAAGVAAGALAFEGIRSLFGGAENLFEHHGGGGHGFLGDAGTADYGRDDSTTQLGDELGPGASDTSDQDDTDQTDDDDYSDDYSDSDDDGSSGNDLV